SQEKFTGNGGISFTVTQEGTDSIMVGLSSSNSDAGYASIGYAVYLFMNRIYIFESGAFRGSFGTYLDGDSFSVERTDSTIDYMKNGTAFYTSATTTNAALLADFAIHNSGGAISNVRFNTNQVPALAQISDITVNEGEAVVLNPTATDADGDTLTFSYSGWMTSSSYTTNKTDAGIYTVTVTVNDGILTDSQDVTITVLNTNQAPVLALMNDTAVTAGDTVVLSPTATDADGDVLTFSYSGWMMSNSYTTNNTDAGTHTVTVTVSDGMLADTQDVTITVLNTNQAPVLVVSSPIVVNEGEAVVLNPTATDADGDTLTFSYSGWMTSSSYTTNNTDAGTHTVTVTVSDGSLTDTQNVAVTVSGGQMNASIYDAAASTTNIIWTDIVGVTIGSNTITKSAAAGWGNGGAASQEKFTGNGGISFTVTQEG
ncbi:MAG: hypothetical protein GY784_17420, partial [Gammaproteobacteria bacterium]|nr:hypothetical protein [Gammaproteobacteria bacterium]